MNNRDQELQTWVEAQFPASGAKLCALAGDASFRRYFRLTIDQDHYVVADAPPETEKNQEFLLISDIFARSGIKVPQVFAKDLQHGFMVLTDFGDCLLFDELSLGTASGRYQQALQILKRIHMLDATKHGLPKFDAEFMMVELKRFQEWFVERLLKVTLDATARREMDNFFQTLCCDILQQPQVCIHRDFHSRNLMVLDDDSLGVIDFQDAMIGPLTYDLISLVKDCYIDWPDEIIQNVFLHFYQEIARPIALVSFETFEKWCHMMVLQRHIKCLGIFARLSIRDDKQGYLQNAPRMLNYLVTSLQLLPEYSYFLEFINEHVVPHYKAAQE